MKEAQNADGSTTAPGLSDDFCSLWSNYVAGGLRATRRGRFGAEPRAPGPFGNASVHDPGHCSHVNINNLTCTEHLVRRSGPAGRAESTACRFHQARLSYQRACLERRRRRGAAFHRAQFWEQPKLDRNENERQVRKALEERKGTASATWPRSGNSPSASAMERQVWKAPEERRGSRRGAARAM